IEPLLNTKNEITGTLGLGLDITERRKMELALQESERTYRELFDNAAILLFTIDLEGNFTSANKYALLHFGYEHEDLLGRNIFDLILPGYSDYVRSKINEKLDGTEITTYITEILDGHGIKKTIEMHTRLIKDGEHPIGIQGAGRDITEQKRTQLALEASEQKFRTLAEDSTAIVYILKGNRFVYVNPALIKLTAFTEEELLNMNFWDVVHPDFCNLAQNRGLARQQGINVPAAYELKLLTKRQESVWIYLTGSQIVYEGEKAVMASAIDITELKRGQEALQESQTLLNHIINFLPDATLVINSAGQILSWNRAMEKLTGIDASNMLGKSNYEYALPFYGERRPMLIDMVLEPDEVIKLGYSYINRGDENITVETFISDFRPGGAYLWGFATPLNNASGEVIGAIETIRDVTERRQMENEVINQAESLRMILEQSPTGIAIVDKDQNFVFINSRLTEITGYTLEHIANMEEWEQKAYPNEKSRKVLHDKWRDQLAIKKRAQGLARVHCKNGQIRDVEFHGIKLPDGRTIVSAWDVTWQKQVEEKLRAGEARFKALSDASFEGIILTENGICIDVNQKAADMFGYDYGEMIGMDAGDFAVPESRTEVLNNIANQYELPYEGSALRKDGSSLPVEVQGRVFDYQGRRIRAAAIRDLSERRQAEAELLKQRQNLQALFYNSPDALALLNNEQEILEVNPQFITLFGYKAEECRHKHLKDLIVPLEYMEEYKKHSQLVSMGEAVQMETIRKNKSGWVFDVMVKTVPITNYGLYVMYSDISERKKAEQIINEQVKELEAKNAEMERFTYTVSHDLRSPLITIKGFAGLLIEDLTHGNHHRLEKDLQRIINAADKMDDLLRDLLELSRVGRMLNAFTKFSMTSLTKEVAELITGRLKERGVTLLINPDMPEVNADIIRIREVLQNLLENAIKFMGNQTQPRIEIGFTDNLKEWTFFIRDNGIGIETRYHNSIFGLFNKLDPNCEGTGIGLSLVKRIIEFHNGIIWVESSGTGQGATFYFTLPKQ
ncbi:MAG: PAS domain S-box protein, partial [Syntrophomonadaceae bacterium]|nr:PAS domain S-box protein [Syntrophomonadaceae bacterium]